MRYISAAISFLFVFAGVFFICGLFLMPWLPPIPEEPVTALEAAYWYDNWIGILLGLVLGILSARAVLNRHQK